jgi:hypothetical protein
MINKKIPHRQNSSKLKKKPKVPSGMNNPDTGATFGTRYRTGKINKAETQHRT